VSRVRTEAGLALLRTAMTAAAAALLAAALFATLLPQQEMATTSASTLRWWAFAALCSVCAAAMSLLSRRSTARLHQAQHQFRIAFEHASIGMALLDGRGRVLQANRSLEQLLGCGDESLAGLRLNAYVGPEHVARLDAALHALSVEHFAVRLEVQLRHPESAPRWGLVAASWLAGATGVPARVVLQIENVTERREAEARMSHLATHDGLTGLANRSLLRSRLDGALARTERVGVLFLDLDRFKVVNDGLGHAAGDALLVAVAERLAAVQRPGDLVARIGGDEFVMLCHDVGHEGDLLAVAARVLAAVNRPVTVGTDNDVVVSASIGAAVAVGRQESSDTLLRDADTAMYGAKTAGGGRVQMFVPALHARALHARELEVDLGRVVRDGGLRLVYQPVVDLSTGRVASLEALVRWSHPKWGTVPPSEFVPLAEKSDLVIELGTWVLRRALIDAATWPAVGGATAGVAVNVSPRQLTEPGFPQLVGSLLEQYGVAGDRLCIEVTETALIGDVGHVVAALRALRELGVRLAIDDFGTGHASLSYLTQFPVDTVKIDQSFVAGVATDAGSAAIVGGVVAMAHAYGLRVVAEGAETSEQLSQLRRLGCEYAQGYVLASPMAGDAVVGVLSASASVEALVPQPRDGEQPGGRAGLDEARRYRLLLECARDVSACLDLDSVLERSFTALRKVIAFTGGSIQLVDGDVVRLAATDPPAPPEALLASVPLGKGIGGTIAATGEPRYLPDITIVSAVPTAKDQKATSSGVRSYYGVPLIAEGRVIGLLQIDSVKIDAFDQQDRLLVLSFASVVASAVQTARLFSLELSSLQGDRPR